MLLFAFWLCVLCVGVLWMTIWSVIMGIGHQRDINREERELLDDIPVKYGRHEGYEIEFKDGKKWSDPDSDPVGDIERAERAYQSQMWPDEHPENST
jgi:hypothetical protein